MVVGVSGVIRFFRPLPAQRTCGPAAELNVAAGRRPVSSETRSPVWTASSEQCVVASAGPRAPVGSGEQRLDLGLVEERDDRAVGALGRDREHAGDVCGVFGVAALA